ncbi:MAG: aldose 1-epimerase family protein [Clostridia bacterium]|nr:aldose 1-epimerase family protein [Clostridia bacterium]
MLYTIKNNELEVTLSDKGAELMSVKRGDCEYVWTGDEKFWKSRAPLVFPVCGRFYEGKYTYKGTSYEILCHGFLRFLDLSIVNKTENSITFGLTANEETKKSYPFDFELKITYALDGSKLSVRFDITNSGDVILPATVGGHPGFNVPLGGTGNFSDYYVEFDEECSPDEVVLSENCLVTGKRRAYPLEKGKIIRLTHSLFDNDAIFLARTSGAVTLKSDKTDRFVKMIYPELPYIGFWHMPKTEAPYVCIEPFCGLPCYDGVNEDIETRHDMFRILPGSTKTIEYHTIFG